VIRDHRGHAPEVVDVGILPIGGAEEPVQEHQRRCLAVRARVPTPIEVHLFERKVIEKMPESGHHPPVQVVVVLVLVVVYAVEITT
jgi:hypothetical protein